MFFISIDRDTAGQSNKQNWNKQPNTNYWIAYTAKLHGEPATVAIFGNPKNPIKTIAFSMGDAGRSFAYMGITLGTDKNPVDIPAGGTLAFQYRVALWDGVISAEEVEREYQKYISNTSDKK